MRQKEMLCVQWPGTPGEKIVREEDVILRSPGVPANEAAIGDFVVGASQTKNIWQSCDY